MARANLTYKSERLLGEFLPTVYFKSILIASNQDSERAEAMGNLVVKVDASIGFTKPDSMSASESKQFINDNMSNLYLYSWVSPFQDVNISLENLNFKIFDLYKNIYDLENPSIENFTSTHLLYQEFKDATFELYTDTNHPHGGSISGPFSIEDYSALTSTFQDRIGGGTNTHTLQEIMAISDMNLNAFFAWAMVNASDSSDSSISEALLDLDNVDSLTSYLIWGNNYHGPWNKENTVNYDTYVQRLKSVMMKVAMGSVPTYLETHGSEAAAIAAFIEDNSDLEFESGETLIDTAMAMIDASLHMFGEIAETAVPEGMSTFFTSMFADLGISTTEASKTTNSYVYEWFNDIMETFSFDHAQFAGSVIQSKKVSLKDLIATDNDYGSKLISNKTFDSKNQEIFKISNIKLNFVYETDVAGTENPVGYTTEFLNEVKKLFLIATVGIDVEDKITQLEDEGFQHNKHSERNLLNSYFGNITFEEIMNKGVVPRAYFEHYIYSDDGAPFDGIPTQGLNGKYYSDETVSRDTIIDSYKKLIQTYKNEKQKSSQLTTNMNNLDLILEKHRNSADIVEKIKVYQKTYADKRPGSVSGRMYNDFRALMVRLNKLITSQRTVERRVSLNSIILDIRITRPIGNTYVPIQPNTAKHLKNSSVSTTPVYNKGNFVPTGGELLNLSDYISFNATKIVRNLDFVQIGDDLLLESELTHLGKEVISSAIYRFDEMGSDIGADISIGVGAAEIEAMTAEILEDEAERILEYSGVDVSKVNMIVRNKGYFFFDLEKAMHTVSRMAHVVDLRKLNVFMNLTIPYKNFRVHQVKLKRWSLGLDFPEEDYSGTTVYAVSPSADEVWPYMVETNMTSVFKTSHDFPTLKSTYHQVIPTDTMSWDERIHYGRPFAELTDATGENKGAPIHSCVKYVFYDIARNSEPHRHAAEGAVGLDPSSPYAPYRNTPCLKDFGSAEGWPTLTPGAQGFADHMVTTPGIGHPHLERKSKSYRMLGFEFDDFYDDDVAEMNTSSTLLGKTDFGVSISHNEARRLALSAVNPAGNDSDWYEVEIQVQDTSLSYFASIYGDVIRPLLDVFEEYADYAEELCSYNTSTDEFNQFFVDAMVERYITNPAEAFYSESGTILGSVRSAMSTLTLDTEYLSETSIRASIEGDVSGTMSLDEMNIAEYLKTIPPWVAGALLKSFIKEIFFNETPKDSLFKVFYGLVQAFDSYDPETGPPDTETLKFIQEMYNLTPQKGNLPAISAFIDDLDPLLKIFRLEDDNLRNNLSILTGISLDDPDFYEKVTGPEGSETHTFKTLIQIDKPISPGMSRFYMNRVSDSYVFAGGEEGEVVIPGSDSAFGASDYYGVKKLGLSDFTGIRKTAARKRKFGSTSWGLKSWLKKHVDGPASVLGSSTYVNQWLQEFVPDYVDWQERCKKTFEAGGGTMRAGPIPGESLFAGKSSHRIYLPKEYNDARVREFLDHIFDGGESLPPGVSGDARAEYLRHFTHMYVTSIFIGTDGKARPQLANWEWYPDPALDDVASARIEDVDFPGSDGSPIGEVTYPDAD